MVMRDGVTGDNEKELRVEGIGYGGTLKRILTKTSGVSKDPYKKKLINLWSASRENRVCTSTSLIGEKS